MDSCSITPNRFLPFSQHEKNKLLFEVATVGNTEVAEELIEAGACLEARNQNGSTPLITAAYHGRTAMVDLFIRRSANVNAVDNLGSTALLHASLKGSTAIVALLIQAKANVGVIDSEGETALLCAVQNDRTAIVDLLIQSGASLNIELPVWNKALIYAIQYKQPETAFYLLNAMTDEEIETVTRATAELHDIVQRFDQIVIGNQQKLFALFSYLIYIETDEAFHDATPSVKEKAAQLSRRFPDWYNQRLEADLLGVLNRIGQARVERKDVKNKELILPTFSSLSILSTSSIKILGYLPVFSNKISEKNLGKENKNPVSNGKKKNTSLGLG